MAVRAIPNMVLIRPADAAEAAEAWRVAAQRKTGPVAMVLTRQNLPVLDRTKLGAAAGLARGAYVISDAAGGGPQAVLIGTGSEVALCLAAQDLLAKEGVRTRVVSMPSWELFAVQDESYRNSVLPPALTARVSVEAGVTFGWKQWVGDRGASIGIDRFGASAPAEALLGFFGFTPERVAEAVRRVIAEK